MRAFVLPAILGLVTAAQAQIISATVDILSPGDDGYDGLPPNLIVIDYFVDVAETDVWTAAGTRVLTQNGAALVYADGDPNTPGVQPTALDPGLEQRYSTFVSRPRARNGNGRFTNGGAMLATGYPTSPTPTLSPGLFGAVWFRSPPAAPSTPSMDGYVARIAIDLGTASDRRDFLMLSTNGVPPGAIIYAQCNTYDGPPGWTNATFDVPGIPGIDWYLFDPVPEPATLILLAGGVALLAGRRRD